MNERTERRLGASRRSMAGTAAVPMSSRPGSAGVVRLTVSVLTIAAIGLAGCGSTGYVVGDGVYAARVPSSEQLAIDGGFPGDIPGDIPGGFTSLRSENVDHVELRVTGDDLTFSLDGVDSVVRRVVDRRDVRDEEGSGPFRAEMQVLVLGGEPLVLAGLVIEDPVIWPGHFDASPVVTVTSFDADARGPDVSCGPDETCLVLSGDVDPAGRYENMNDPELGQSPVAAIEVTDAAIEYHLAAGPKVIAERSDSTVTDACGLAETSVWTVPVEVGSAMDDPVLVETVCPLSPGSSIQLVIMERAKLPVLAPLGAESDGEWCEASLECLWFVPA